MTHILSAVAWPYANGPRHIGHVAGFGVPSDVFSRYMRMAGHDVLMVSGTDEHRTPILVAADEEGLSARELADRNNRLIVEDLVALGLSYDLFTRTTAGNHYHVVQDMFTTVRDNGYMVQQVTRSAISPSTGRTLPDRYIEGTCPICGAEGARGDQCDTCGNQLDPTDLISPRSRINGETPEFVETTHWFLDLPALAQALGAWLDEREASGTWRPNVIKFSQNFLSDIRPRAMTRDIDWGIPVPGWEDQPTKRLYVWFDAVIGYLSASVEWARRSGDPEAWRAWWNDPQALSYYFMGKDNIVFHSQIWPAELLGYNGQGAAGGEPGRLGVLNLPTEVVSSEFLTMEGKKFSSSHGIVIYVRDFLQRYQAAAPRSSARRRSAAAMTASRAWVPSASRTSSLSASTVWVCQPLVSSAREEDSGSLARNWARSARSRRMRSTVICPRVRVPRTARPTYTSPRSTAAIPPDRTVPRTRARGGGPWGRGLGEQLGAEATAVTAAPNGADPVALRAVSGGEVTVLVADRRDPLREVQEPANLVEAAGADLVAYLVVSDARA